MKALFLILFMQGTFISPIEHVPNNGWLNCEYAYDGDISTFAIQIIPTTTEPLELVFPAYTHAESYSLTIYGESYEIWYCVYGNWHQADLATADPTPPPLPPKPHPPAIERVRIISRNIMPMLVNEFSLFVPEPATIILLALGMLLIIKKLTKKNQEKIPAGGGAGILWRKG